MSAPPNPQSAIRNPQSAILLALLLLGAALPGLAQKRDNRPLWVCWQRQVEPLQALALSQEGDRLVRLDRKGQATCIDTRGQVLWSRRLEGVSRLVVGPEARLTAAYWRDSYLRPLVLLVGPKGEDLFRLDCGSPVGPVAISPVGGRVAVGTRAGDVYLLEQKGKQFRRRKLRVEGAVSQLFFGRANELYLATQSPAGLGRITPAGTLSWYHGRGHEAAYLVSAAPDGSWIAVAERRRSAHRFGSVHLWNREGEKVWTRALDGIPVTVRAAHGGKRIVVGLEAEARAGSQARSERQLVCFDARGELLWRRGGALFDPFLVTMDTGGEWVVSLVQQSKFYLLDKQGEIMDRRSASAPVQIAVGSADGSSIGVLFADGRLTWHQVPRAVRQ